MAASISEVNLKYHGQVFEPPQSKRLNCPGRGTSLLPWGFRDHFAVVWDVRPCIATDEPLEGSLFLIGSSCLFSMSLFTFSAPCLVVDLRIVAVTGGCAVDDGPKHSTTVDSKVAMPLARRGDL